MSSLPMERIRHSRGPSPQDWEENREVIMRLYPMTTLRQLRDEMILRGFKASEDQFKKRLKKWGLRKYRTTDQKKGNLSTIYCDDGSSGRHAGECKSGDQSLRTSTRHTKSEVTGSDDLQGTLKSIEDPVVLHCGFGSFWKSASVSSSSFVYTGRNGCVDMGLLFRSIRASCSYCVPDSDPFAGFADTFWNNMKMAIHLLRIDSPGRARLALTIAQQVASEALRAGNMCGTIQEIVAILSPINMRACLEIRRDTIAILSRWATYSLGRNHPITIVLQQLYADDMSSDVPDRCLSYMTEITYSSSNRSAIKSGINAQLSVSRLLRKKQDYENALHTTQLAHETVVSNFGPESAEVCWVLRQQEHIYIDKEDYGLALEACLAILQAGRKGQDSGSKAFDKCLVRTMEDIAYSFECLGNVTARAYWLDEAQAMAFGLSGDCVSTGHIIDKANGLLTRSSIK
ncbi:hypothetical protein M426DRAFT_258717 [Hypoxylon sp. CI-4A]|nr:hypothetical protein M426DRAFT_258717 [Hypoxylon sp. CI-4A]